MSRKKNSLKEQIINIHAEAYYKAMRRFDDEQKLEEQKSSNQDDASEKTEKCNSKGWFMLNIILFPWTTHRNFAVNNKIYDSILVMFVSFVLALVGTILWGMGLLVAGYGVFILFKDVSILGTAVMCPLGLVILMFGSLFILASNEFSKVTDSNKIYAYSASVIALISCVVAILTLLDGIIK